MPLTEAQRRSLARKAANGSLEVEHLLRVAIDGGTDDVPFLRELQNEHQWPSSNSVENQMVVPLGRWADTVCTFLEDGYAGLIRLAGKSSEAVPFCLGLLETLSDPASATALLTIGKAIVKRTKADLDFALSLASSFNRLLSFKGATVLTPDVEQQIRAFLHALLGAELAEAQRATAVCALRAVGDEESLTLIATLPAFTGSWVGLGSAASKQIKKRLRGT